MHDNEDGNERLLDIREVEEPRRFLSGYDSQRGGNERWGLSDTGSVIDLALAEDNEPTENQPDSAKKRWRSDTMVDRDTYLMGKLKRESSLEKVFTEAQSSHSPTEENAPSLGSEPRILDIAAPAPAEPHIPSSEPPTQETSKHESTPAEEPPQQEEELMKPPIVVPSQARPAPEPEPADPILEEPPITPAPVPIAVPALSPEDEEVEEEKEVQEKAQAEEETAVPAAELASAPVEEKVEEEAAPEEDSGPSEDITSSAVEPEPIATAKSEETVDSLLGTSEEEPQLVEEVPEKEEDVTEAEVEEVAPEVVPPAEPSAPSPPDVETEEKEKEKEEETAKEGDEDVAAAQPAEPITAATTEP